MSPIDTTVAIIGAGPGGLTLAHLLAARGIECQVFERSSRQAVLERARAGLLENRTVALFDRMGLSDRLHREAQIHAGCEFRYSGRHFFSDYTTLNDAGQHLVYPQQEMVRDLVEAYEALGHTIEFGTEADRITNLMGDPVVRFTDGGSLRARIVVGADGKHGAGLHSVPKAARNDFTMVHEFQWLTLLAATGPSAPHTIYAQHETGFAGHLLRSNTVTRFHLQVPPTDTVTDWPDKRIWNTLRERFHSPGFVLKTGPVIDKNMLDMQSRVTEPMVFGNLALLGDAAHIITPSGGKGMNLAVADAEELDRAITDALTGDPTALQRYSATRLPDVWQAQEFSHTLIHMMHTYRPDSPDAAFRQKLQQSRLWQLENMTDYARSFAARYVGPPLPEPAVASH